MRTRVFVYAALALLAALPSSAFASITVNSTTIQPSGDVTAGATASVVCVAEGNTVTGMAGSTVATTIEKIDVTVSDGGVYPTIPGPASTRTCTSGSGTCSYLSGNVGWMTPPTPATITATCTVSYHDTTSNFLGTSVGPTTTVSSSATVTTVSNSPTVSAISGPTQTIVGATASYSVTASDPANRSLTYSWSATGGTITQDPQNPANASWQAPSVPGSADITVTVSNGVASMSQTTTVTVVLSTYQAGLPVTVRMPTRITASDSGALFLIDASDLLGQVMLVTPKGETVGFTSAPEPALAVAYGAGKLWVTTTAGKLYKFDAFTGRLLGEVALADGSFGYPQGIAYDPTHMTLWIADAAVGCVRVVRPDGTAVTTITNVNGGSPLYDVKDIAIDAAHGRAWVLKSSAQLESTVTNIADARLLHAFDLDANYLGSYISFGGSTTQMSIAGGIAVSPSGRVYISDRVQGTVFVFEPDGTFVTKVGQAGMDPGQLYNPSGVAFMKNGDLVVADSFNSRVDRFGDGSPLPTCAGDSDCDGLPDAWENSHGLAYNSPGDALLDPDHDGLNNREELLYGTNPLLADTDGDGYSDLAEILAGADPLDPYDHTTISVTATGPAETTPGLVKLTAVATGSGTCGVTWTQTAGPTVALRGANTGSASFVARAEATYELEAVARCGTQTSAPAFVHVNVLNVPPVADAGRTVVASTGAPIRLNPRFSSDANGDALAYQWVQTLGPATSVSVQGGVLTMRPRRAGLYAFQLSAGDGKASGTAEVPILIASGSIPTAIASALPADGQVGSEIQLDAGDSIVDTDTPTFSWEQVAGPDVALTGASEAVATFTPTAPGRYAFEVTVTGATLRAPAARVEVFVSATGSLPVVTVDPQAVPTIVAVNAPVSLPATAASGLGIQWKQVAGPGAGLTDAGLAMATVVPFSPGFYAFEVSAFDGDAVSHPARVTFEARANGAAIPVARVSVPELAPSVGQLVFLDGRQSTGATHFRWTQVSGPWVILGAQNAVTSFRPPLAGVYAFELEVDGGTVRSAPARVEVNVSEQGVQ